MVNDQGDNEKEDLEKYQGFSESALVWARFFSSLIGASYSFPFGPDTMVFKVAGKVFGLIYEKEDILRLNLKCDPEHALELRDVFNSVVPGYHMNKKHWNTLLLDGELPPGEIERQIEHSYLQVVNKLPKKQAALLSKGML